MTDGSGWWRRRVRLRRGRLGVVSLAMVLVCTLTLPAAVNAALATDVGADADWIMSARLPDGAIANYVDRQAVWPYLSNFAAMGLARATAVTKNASYAAAAWSWLAWYQAHQNAQGFVTDYTIVRGVLTSTNDMDSTDAYAGTFLLATRETYRVTNDLTRLRGLTNGIGAAVRAIEATQDADGLTWAKPTWHVKYLMDQAEAYAGLLAAVDLAKALGKPTLAQKATTDASRMKAGVANLWNSASGAYDWAVHDNGSRQPTDWSILYSDSLQQAWAAAFGLVDQVRAPLLVTKFNTSQPNWHLPAATAWFGSSQAQVGYWPAAGLAFDAVGSALAAAAAADIRAGSLAANRAWPFTTGNAGQLILFESGYALPLAVAASPPTTATTTPSGTTGKAPTPTVPAPKTTLPTSTTTSRPTTTTVPGPSTSTTTTLLTATATVNPNGASVSVSPSPTTTLPAPAP